MAGANKGGGCVEVFKVDLDTQFDHNISNTTAFFMSMLVCFSWSTKACKISQKKAHLLGLMDAQTPIPTLVTYVLVAREVIWELLRPGPVISCQLLTHTLAGAADNFVESYCTSLNLMCDSSQQKDTSKLRLVNLHYVLANVPWGQTQVQTC